MKILSTILVFAALPAAFVLAQAQAQEASPERAFVASGKSCDRVTWSRRTLRLYPNIANACRAVVAREGQYYARFEGEVVRTSSSGRQVTLRLTSGDLMTFSPPRTLSVYVDGRRTSYADLRRGDRFSFYIPQDSLAVTFYVENPGVAPVQSPVIYESAADREPD